MYICTINIFLEYIFFGWYFIFLEIPLPNEQARLDILKIHAAPITKMGDIGNNKLVIHFHVYSITSAATFVIFTFSLLPFQTDYEAVVKLSEDFNGADLRNVCTEAGK